MIRKMLLSTTLIALAGCSSILTPSPVKDGAGFALPVGYDYRGSIADLKAPEKDWWSGFGSQPLDALVAQALSANQTLAQGIANIDASRAALKVANASLLPQASGSLSASSDTQSGLDDVDVSGRLSASYQLDLFGANAASRAGALANFDAAVF